MQYFYFRSAGTVHVCTVHYKYIISAMEILPAVASVFKNPQIFVLKLQINYTPFVEKMPVSNRNGLVENLREWISCR